MIDLSIIDTQKFYSLDDLEYDSVLESNPNWVQKEIQMIIKIMINEVVKEEVKSQFNNIFGTLKSLNKAVRK